MDYGICTGCQLRDGKMCTYGRGTEITHASTWCTLFQPTTAAKTAEANATPTIAPMHEKIRTLGRALADLVSEKNQAYGSSFEKSGEFLRILYPDGLKPEQYGDALLLVRIFDKQMRIATRKDAFGESPFKDIAGYGLIGAAKDDKP
jgi:hypothetical protein